MPNDLDHLLARLSAAHVASPAGLDEAVMATIAGRREEARRARILAPVRLGAVGLALAVGVAAGGAGAARAMADPAAPGMFSAADALAPSTLLEGRG